MSRCDHLPPKQILRFDHWEYLISQIHTMLNILDETGKLASEDTDEASESFPLLGSAGTLIAHTKLGSPKPEATLEGFMQVLTGPGTPLPHGFQGKLEAFLNTLQTAGQMPCKRYLRVQKGNKVTKFISIIYVLLMCSDRLWSFSTYESTMSPLWTGSSVLISSTARSPSMVDSGTTMSSLQQNMAASSHTSCAFSRSPWQRNRIILHMSNHIVSLLVKLDAKTKTSVFTVCG